MATEVSKTQIDRLGERLKKGNVSEADLRLLDEYRHSFAEAYETVVRTIQEQFLVLRRPTGRLAKLTSSIIEKLRREKSRLTQIQDIAGCRLIVTDIADQEEVVQSLNNLFELTTTVDRRKHPSHGYRAVHIIVKSLDKLVEIQVRTKLQDLWAELSEKLSDTVDPAIKYGGGDNLLKERLTHISLSIAEVESLETRLPAIQGFSSLNNLTDEQMRLYMVIQRRKGELSEQLSHAIDLVKGFGTKE
jgi:ppGpp synthetase/RelA/SpoT-type nucleotidyltranferase